ncbi:MAG: PIN domain-containing protein, partial [Pseudomonadota bacterium]
IMTLNAKDFPRHILAEEGLKRIDPDAFLVDLWQAMPEQIEAVGGRVHGQARRLSGEDWQIRSLLKKARLPRLAKALSQG